MSPAGHRALFSTVRTQDQHVVGDERAIKAVIRDGGRGHMEIDWSPGDARPFQWLGTSPESVAEYAAAIERRDGPELARRRLFEGPRTR